MTLNGLMAEFSQTHLYERRGSALTVSAYQSDVRAYERYLLEHGVSHPTLEHLGPDELRGFLRHMTQQGLAEATVMRRMHALLSLGGYAFNRRFLLDDPRRGVFLPRHTRLRRDDYATATELRVIVNRALDRRGLDYAGNGVAVAVTLLGTLALRRKEVLDLTWGSIRRDGDLTIHGKGRRLRYLPLPEEVHTILLDARRIMGLTGDVTDKAPMVQSVLRRRLSANTLNLAVKELVRETRCNPRLSPHALRHGVATLLDQRGATQPEVMAVLGHSPTGYGPTLSYCHVPRERLRELICLVASVVLGRPDGTAVQHPA